MVEDLHSNVPWASYILIVIHWGEVKLLSHVRLFATPWTVAYQASPMGFSRQEYWSGLPFLSPEDLPHPGIEPGSPALQADALPSEPPGKSYIQFSSVTHPPAPWEIWGWLLKIQPVHPKGDQSWVFIGRTDAEAETQVLWPPHGKSWFIGRDPDAGRDWGQEKGTTEDEMAGWHH